MGEQIDIYGNKVQESARSMADYFIVPPFSIIDTTTRDWQARKKRWDRLIGDKGESREDTLYTNTKKHDYNFHKNRAKLEAKLGHKISEEEYYDKHYKPPMKSVSLLDACLAEVVCKWFGKQGFKAFDPFAGDSVFGFVACDTGLDFVGIELRQEQADLNQNRLKKAGLSGQYICDTSENMDKHIPDESVDMVFSCPPYLWLEKYSDMEEDLSTMSEEEFFKVYGGIIQNTYKKLRKNRFAIIVISEVRDKKMGNYVGFIPKTIDLMVKAGYLYYNEIILKNSVGSLPMRAGKAMNSGRKVGRMHQNVLVFYKGDPKMIKEDYEDIIPKNDYYENL